MEQKVTLIVCFALISMSPRSLETPFSTRLIIWNVGQGQWVTLLQNNDCFHFDMGGEFFNWSRLIHFCGQRYNEVYFTHGDWDHIRFFKTAQKKLKSLCLQMNPPKNLSGPYKMCSRPLPLWVESFVPPPNPQLSPNDLSVVFLLKETILIPGDSTTRMEKTWVQKLALVRHTQLLILGHHGSATSTGSLLLNALPKLKWTITSAREAKYGHPSARIKSRLRKIKKPLLKTEAWNHIIIELDH